MEWFKKVLPVALIAVIVIGLYFGISSRGQDETYVIAVIDTGVDYTHPDIKDHMWVNTTDLPGTHGYDFINDDEDPMDDYGHGTHCAGIILKEAERLGIKGKVQIMALKYMDQSGAGLYQRAIDAYQYILDAKKKGVNIVAVSNSWGITENPVELETIIKEAGEMGILSICAAGNSAENLDRYKTFPAGYMSPYTVIVAAATDTDALASFSCYGKHSVDVAALGTDVLAPYYTDAYLPSDNLEKAFTWTLNPSGDEVYTEGATDVTYANSREYTFEKPLAAELYFGIEFMSHSPKQRLGVCYVESYQDGYWMQIGAFGLPEINFYNTKYFALREHTEKIRLICTRVDAPMDLNIRKMGYGESGGKYFKMSGTSMATPKVAAEAIWLMESFPEASLEEIRARIIGGVDKVLPADVVASDGIADPARAKKAPAPVAVESDLEGDVVTLKGWFFGKTAGTAASDYPCEVLQWADQMITLRYGGSIEDSVDFTISRADGVSSTQRMIFNTRSKAWVSRAPLPEKLAYATAVSCNQAVYVIGGSFADTSVSNAMYRYDPEKNSWESCGKIVEAEQVDFLAYGMSAVCYGDKIVLMTFDSATDQNRFFRYDPKTELWEPLAFKSAPPTRANGTLAVFKDALYLVGGIAKGAGDADANSIWRLDAGGERWEEVAKLSGERFDAIASEVGDFLMIVGGKQGENKPVSSCEIFDGQKVSTLEACPIVGVHSGNATYSGGEKLTLFTDGNTFDAKGVQYDPAKGQWTRLNQRLGFFQRTESCHAVLGDELFLIGGFADSRVTDQVDSIRLP